ncbi:MAG: hypothetical protein WBV36_03440 [Terriglobales bacterium]
MSLSHRIILPFAIVSLALLVACGNNNGPAPNSEGFSNSNLNGTYVFFSQGFDSNGFPLTLAGAFVANGSGGITGGSMDAVDPNVTVATNQQITSGSYGVNTDGRGQVTLNSAAGTFILDVVLTSGASGLSSHGLVTEFDTNGSGSGTLDLQTAIAQTQIAGAYAFTLSGSDGAGNPFASVGSFTLNSSGITTAGVQDFNDAALPLLNESLTGSALLGSGTSPGTMGLASSFGALTFDFYPIDTTHFKVVETDGLEFLAGDVFTQTGASIPNSPMVFTMSGGVSALISSGGVMTSAGNGNFTGGLEDLNNNGSVAAQVPFSGVGSSGGSVGGRVIVSLTGFAPAIQWVIYPSSGGLLMLESDSLDTTIGTAYAETTGATLSTSQGYGFNLSAFNTSGGFAENDLAEFASVSGTYTGGIDISDDDGAGINLTPNEKFVVSFTGPDATGRGTATTTVAGSGYVSFNFYTIDDSTALLLESDTNQIGTGIFGLQTSAGSSVAARGAFSTARPLSRARLSKKALERKK